MTTYPSTPPVRRQVKKPSAVIFGHVCVPHNSPNQLHLGTRSVSNSPSTSHPLVLGGSWRALQQAKQKEDEQNASRIALVKRLQNDLNNQLMINEDLFALTLRNTHTINKLKIVDLKLENELDTARNESDQLRQLHYVDTVSLEQTKGKLVTAEAKANSLETCLTNNGSVRELLTSEIDCKVSNLLEVEAKLQSSQALNKKLRAGLEDTKKQAALYLKLKDDKDGHIALLVKEKNRLHDTIQDMAKRYAKTTHTVRVAEKIHPTADMMVEEEHQEEEEEWNKENSIDLDDIVNGQSDIAAMKLPTPPPARQQQQQSATELPHGSLNSALLSIDASSGSVRDRLLLNTIKKMSKELKRKEEEKEKMGAELEKALRRNEDMSRRIKNFTKGAGGGVATKKVVERVEVVGLVSP